MDISIILPVHNEVENLRPLIVEIEEAMRGGAWEYEVIAVDDCSTDGSTQVLRELAARNPVLKVLFFRQNYGQSAAFDAGFRHVRGRVVVTMDADRQNDPRDILMMVGKIDGEGYDFVAGRRAARHDALVLRRIPSLAANAIIRRITGTRLRDLGCSLKAYRRELTDELRLYGEMHRFIGVLVEGMGAKTIEVPVHHRPRTAGQSKYGLSRIFKVLLDLLTVWFLRGYQTKPVYVFGGVGLALATASVLLSGFVLYQKLARGIWVHRNPLFALALVFFVVSVQFLALGLLAEIMVRTYFESRQRPAYLIREALGFTAAGCGAGTSSGGPMTVTLFPGVAAVGTRRGAGHEPEPMRADARGATP